MKFLVFIFALLILGLSSIPCSDEIFDQIDTTLTENHSNDNGGDNCTPFCICSCCGIAISFEVLNYDNKETNNDINKIPFRYEKQFLKGYITSIWHPPAHS